jgi:HAD superfamily hydrolase (TIGR01490 family)
MGQVRQVAAFDFDGTLARGDSLLPFLLLVRGRATVGRTLAFMGPRITAALVGWGDRDTAKDDLIARIFGGVPAATVADLGAAYAQQLVARRLRPSMVERVAWHRAQGHQLVLVSASLAVYLEPLGKLLGFDEVFATALEVGPDGLLTGKMLGANVRGPEKAARVTTWLAGDEHELWAYGDSAGDRDLLALAHTPMLVRRGTMRPWRP